ncbi:hypothetical protein [Leptospira noguchii]|uniref:Uncharacterized protein n=1 Tax=Leptospira noguchii serovar Autumnalis str. ZUN142 TaxID=1085540 RepID=M6UR01_9LEPT|nr:hypothetical protein [Leptospira noguchii]EMO39698.1 hypothetical protein LEP1GSC186_3748 [Leptospira noguchii serovar Autumnalis str. ZUN142]UOG50527.1 hypothetical protein MAL00_02535 [Leptospira noguchii]
MERKELSKTLFTKAFETQHNAHYHNLTHKLNRILESKLNSAKRFPELSVSLLGSLDRSRLKLNTTLSMNRVVGSKTHIFQVFRQE